ncbi:hypothetical protein DT075_35560 [Bacillus licheniformis]|nr:hypothetical protein DT075_35560 [Bacillus licheniformis]
MTVYGPQNVLDSLEFVEADEIDLSKIKDDTELEAGIKVPDGAKKMSPEKVKIKVKVDKEEEKKLKHQTVEKEAKLTVYDKDGNVLPVEVSPSVVKITVPVTSPSKKIPVKVDRKGSLPDGISISSLDISPGLTTVTIEEKTTKEFPVEVDFYNKNKMKDGYTPELPIINPKNVSVTGSKAVIDRIQNIKATINLEGVQNYVVTGVPQTVNVTIKGPTGTVKKVRQVKDFEIYADMQNLKTGRHKVELKARNVADGLTLTINPSRRKMDKFLNNPWAVKVVALLFAFLLYFAVHSAQAPTPKKPGESFFPTSTTDEATLTDIPVKSFYDDGTEQQWESVK